MASRADIEFTYTTIDRVVRLSLGEFADFSGARYEGDFSLTLEQAQRRKQEYIARELGLSEGRRLLDLGCGWGALLDFARSRGTEGVGVALSRAQVAACRGHGLDAHLQDARTVERATFGAFDAVASLGAFEHFCSPEDYRAGRQERIYSDLFTNVAGLLPSGGCFYLQTMVFGRNMIPIEQVSEHAPRDSDAFILFLLGCQFPGSLLPWGLEQIERCAAPHFRVRDASSGRVDYIETITQWNRRIGARSMRKSLLKLRLLPFWLRSHEFRMGFSSGVSANKLCFERELLDHYRIILEKVD